MIFDPLQSSARLDSAAAADRDSPAPPSPRGRIAVICNRYGPGVVGGAEAVLTEVSEGLAARGWQVDILTSTSLDHYTWAQDLPAGETFENGNRVLRFRTHPPIKDVRDRIGNLIAAGVPTSVPDQYRWMNAGARAPGMYAYMQDHAQDYDTVLVAPYQNWTSFAIAEIATERTIIHPCLHDEPEARLEIFKAVFAGCKGVWVQTQPELDLTRALLNPPRISMVGSGIKRTARYDPDGFRQRYGIEGDFIFYAGRREWGKGWPQMVDAIAYANHLLDRPLPLVTCGKGDLANIPSGLTVKDLGYLSDDERSSALAACTVYVQPSALESFSRTVLEAWLAGTVVLANEASAVVKYHCCRSRAGFTFRDRFDFAELLAALVQRPSLRAEMAERGREYVISNYDWSDVLDKMEETMDDWM
jgi:glycosyltransferase involved in cell wall biosynthesis